MKKYFKYEFKRNLLPLIVLTVFCTVICILCNLTSEFIRIDWRTGLEAPTHDLPFVSIILLLILCTLTPIMVFWFKMKPKDVDCMYSMPLKREKIYLVKGLIGLILTLAPFTVAFWLDFIITACRPNLFHLWLFIPAYFVSVSFAALLFGVCAFSFTRANNIWDGIIFIAFNACIGFMFVVYFSKAFSGLAFVRGIMSGDGAWYLFTHSPLGMQITKYGELLVGLRSTYTWEWLVYLFGVIVGIASWTGLILTAKKEKAENAGRISDSWFGYKAFIPFYLAFTLAVIFNGDSSQIMLFVVITIMSAVVLYMVFRRSFKLKSVDWLSLLGAVVAGVILFLIANLIEYLLPPPVIVDYFSYIRGIL